MFRNLSEVADPQTRLLVSAAKLAQSLPELKRDGNNVLSSVWAETLFDKSSTSLAGTILSQSEFVPKLIKDLQECPEQVITAFEKLRECCAYHFPGMLGGVPLNSDVCSD